MTQLPPLTYLTIDSLREGVGASQVQAYVERLAERGLDVRLHSFEKSAPDPELKDRLRRKGVRWKPHRFGRPGPRGGVDRVLRGAAAVAGAALVHARSDLPAASALIAHTSHWVWDVRALLADQRIALGTLAADSREHKVLQRIERQAARRSSGIITLTEAVLPVLEQRHGAVVGKASVVPTCVDLSRFRPSEMPARPLHLLLAGTLNAYYDVPTMLRLMEVGRRGGHAEPELPTPRRTARDDNLSSVDATRGTTDYSGMPGRLAMSHAGLSVCRSDAGVSLTAAMPTKIAEFLAVGRPVVVNAGLGDTAVLEETRTGVVLRDLSAQGLEAAWDRLEELVADPDTPTRCRALAEQHYDLDAAIDALLAVYERVAQRR